LLIDVPGFEEVIQLHKYMRIYLWSFLRALVFRMMDLIAAPEKAGIYQTQLFPAEMIRPIVFSINRKDYELKTIIPFLLVLVTYSVTVNYFQRRELSSSFPSTSLRTGVRINPVR